MKNRKYIILLLLFLSFGYAYLSTNLDIIGNGFLGVNKWKVYFDNVRVIEGKEFETIAPITIGDTTTSLNFEANLQKPGDTYSFFVNIMNDSTLDIMLDIITQDNLTEEEQEYAEFKVTYQGGEELETHSLIHGNHWYDTLLVTLSYKRDVDETIIAKEKSPIDVSINLEYVQADETAKYRSFIHTEFDYGEFVNKKIKELAGIPEITSLNDIEYAFYYDSNENFIEWDNDSDNVYHCYKNGSVTSTSTCENNLNLLKETAKLYQTETNIKEVKRSYTIDENDMTEDNIVSSDESIKPIYAWFDNGILYYYSEEKNIFLNKYANDMFRTLVNVESIDLDGVYANYSYTLSGLFDRCRSLKEIDLSKFYTDYAMYMYYMFYECESLEYVDVSSFNTWQVVDMEGMFDNCFNLKEIDVSNFDTSSATDMSYMFYDCHSLTELDVSNFDTSNVKTFESMFYNCRLLTVLDVSNFDTSNAIYLWYMFDDCRSVEVLDVSHFDTSKVKGFDYMFSECFKVKILDVSKFNTSNAQWMKGMFSHCENLENLDVTHFNTSKSTNIAYMFQYCYKLTNLDLRNFVTTNVTDMNSLFEGCEGLLSVDVSSFDTSKVTKMYEMFKRCKKLKTIDISNFNTSKVKLFGLMFEDCYELTTVYVGQGWNVSNETEQTTYFKNSTKIVGGNGTTFNSSNIDISYLIPDGYRFDTTTSSWVSDPTSKGYLTLKV